MKRICVAICTVSLFGHGVFGQDQRSVKIGVEAAGVGGLIVYQTALARPDIAVAKSLVNERLLKGEIGEAIRDQTVGRCPHRSGQWINVSPRLGPQGLDHVSVQLDESGKPSRLMVDETKFGSAKLGLTKSGDIQMGTKWIGDRLNGLAGRYTKIAALVQDGISSAKMPEGLSAKQFLRVPVGDSESVLFWRSGGSWNYDGPLASLPKATQQLRNMATLFRAGADGRIDFRKRIFRVKIDGDILKVNILDATAVDAAGGNLNQLPVKAKLDLPLNRAVWASDTIQVKMVEEIRSQMPYLDADEARRLARGIKATAKTAQEALAQSSFKNFTAVEAAKAGTVGVLIAVPVEVAFELIIGGQVDRQRVAGVGVLAGGSAAIGSTLGNATTFALLRTKAGYSASSAVAELIGLHSAGRLANGAGGLVGGGAIAILFAYGGYRLGYYDLQTANRSAFAGVVGFGAGAAASAVTLGLISSYATAGTGVAISTLGGASASSASLAWLGGGTVASGGMGVAGGTVFLTAGFGIVVIGATAAVFCGFHVYDEHQDNVRLDKTIEYLSAKQTFFVPDAQHSEAEK
jgi:hypothetical protein